MPHPRFRITKGKGNEFFFNLTAANGEIILQSQRYASHSGAVSGVASVKANSGDGRFQTRQARDGSLYFVLVGKNGGPRIGRSRPKLPSPSPSPITLTSTIMWRKSQRPRDGHGHQPLGRRP